MGLRIGGEGRGLLDGIEGETRHTLPPICLSPGPNEAREGRSCGAQAVPQLPVPSRL